MVVCWMARQPAAACQLNIRQELWTQKLSSFLCMKSGALLRMLALQRGERGVLPTCTKSQQSLHSKPLERKEA